MKSAFDIAEKYLNDPPATGAEIAPALCWNCGEPWSEVVTDIECRRWRVCWGCAKKA